MKTITLEQAYDILDRSSAVIIDHVVTYPSLVPLDKTDKDNQFLYLEWTDVEGREYNAIFTQGLNAAPKIGGSDLWLTDIEGNEAQITILMPAMLPD